MVSRVGTEPEEDGFSGWHGTRDLGGLYCCVHGQRGPKDARSFPGGLPPE